MATIFEERRSVRFFDPNMTISDHLLKDIINMAVLAPSAYNLQPWDILVVQSKEAKEKLYNQSNQQPKILEAPMTLIIIGNRNGYDESNPIWSEIEKQIGEHVNGLKNAAAHLYGSTEEMKIKFAESNAGLLAMSIMYAAKYYGVDSHPMSGLNFKGIKEAFTLGENQEVVMAIALGHFDQSKSLHPRASRRQFDEVATVL